MGTCFVPPLLPFFLPSPPPICMHEEVKGFPWDKLRQRNSFHLIEELRKKVRTSNLYTL